MGKIQASVQAVLEVAVVYPDIVASRKAECILAAEVQRPGTHETYVPANQVLPCPGSCAAVYPEHSPIFNRFRKCILRGHAVFEKIVHHVSSHIELVAFADIPFGGLPFLCHIRIYHALDLGMRAGHISAAVAFHAALACIQVRVENRGGIQLAKRGSVYSDYGFVLASGSAEVDSSGPYQEIPGRTVENHYAEAVYRRLDLGPLVDAAADNGYAAA